jgi:hypothetical protein
MLRGETAEDRGYAVCFCFVERTRSVFAGPAAGPREPGAKATLLKRHHRGMEEVVEAEFDCVDSQVVVEDVEVVDTIVAAVIL